MILLVDNYDSFTFNLMQYLSRFDEVHVLRNDDERLYDVAKRQTVSSCHLVQVGLVTLVRWRS